MTERLADTEFDDRLDISTSGYLELRGPGLSNEVYYDYQGTPAKILRRLLAMLDITQNEFTFVDVGCGLGRTLFIAAEAGYGKVLGVEISERFWARCKHNLAKSKLDPEVKERIAVVSHDATTLDLPDTNLVIYLFNPFDQEIMSEFVQNVIRCHDRAPRNIFVVYYNPWYREAWDTTGRFEEVRRGSFRHLSLRHKYYPYVVFRCRAVSTSAGHQ